MASNHTAHFGLNQWAATDPVVREDFNQDNARIDMAMAGFGNCRIATGTYVGTGKNGSENPNSLDFADTLGEAPTLLIVSSTNNSYMLVTKGTVSRYVDPTQENYNQDTRFTWTETGVSWYCPSSTDYQMNLLDTVYTYVAIL